MTAVRAQEIAQKCIDCKHKYLKSLFKNIKDINVKEKLIEVSDDAFYATTNNLVKLDNEIRDIGKYNKYLIDNFNQVTEFFKK